MALTAAWSPRGPWLWGGLTGGCLPFHWEAKNLFQFLSIRRWDGEASNGHFNQGQTHTPDVRLNRIMGALQTLRLHNTHMQLYHYYNHY